MPWLFRAEINALRATQMHQTR